MDDRRIGLGICLLLASAAFYGRLEANADSSVVSLAARQGFEFQQSELIVIQHYYSRAPKVFIDDVVKKDRALPARAAASVVRGKRLPKELIPFLVDAPISVTRNLEPLPSGLDRKVLGTRFLLLDSKLMVQDLVRLPSTVAGNTRR